VKESTLKPNVGTIDQGLRLAIGFVLVFLAGIGVVGAWGYAGVVLMLTAAFRFCPAYRVLGIRTGGARAHKKS
jgi:hypothetical protein